MIHLVCVKESCLNFSFFVRIRLSLLESTWFECICVQATYEKDAPFKRWWIIGDDQWIADSNDRHKAHKWA